MAGTQRPDWNRIRRDFPILGLEVRGRRLAYLDNAATTQKPRAVVDRISHYYLAENASIHRGVHYLSEHATGLFETARHTVARFIGARSEREVIFTRGTTESINLAASVVSQARLKAGDEILLTAMEHHSNIVPWQIAAQKTGAVIRVLPINEAGELCLDQMDGLLSARTRLVAVAHVSNALGTINPVADVTERAHRVGAQVLVDGAQAVSHVKVDVQQIGCDYYAFSAHKLFGPTGVGVLWGRESVLSDLPPYQGGGDMVRSVSFEGSEYADPPARFEAGTPDIAGVIGLGAAVDYVTSIGLDEIGRREAELLEYGTEKLAAIPALRIIGTARDKASIVSFAIDGIHAHDIGTIADRAGVAIRAGHHCAQPVMQCFNVPATARCSLAFYNDETDIDQLVEALTHAKRMFA